MRRFLSEIPRSLIAFVAAYMLACGGLALGRGNVEFLIYAAAMLGFIALVLGLDVRVGFSRATLWLLTVWGGLHMAGGTVQIPASLALDWAAENGETGRTVLYNLRPVGWVPKYDQWTHAFGFFSATVASWEALVAAIRREPAEPRPKLPRLLPAGDGGAFPHPAPVSILAAAALIGGGLGAANELVEFVVTLVVEDHNVGGYVNTGWDIVSNTVGTVLATAALRMLARRRG